MSRDDPTRPLLPHKHIPIPKGPLAALCTARLVDPIAFTQLFPYLNELISDLHLTKHPSHVGFYSGLVETVFAVAQLTSIYPWARLSDIIGRRLVILVGILGIAVTTPIFGLSKSLVAVLIARCIAGLFSGNIAVIHAFLGEITDASNQAVAFPIYGFMWPLGAIVGPLIGGSFSHPADKYPQLFGSEFWKEHPYLFPCLITSIVTIAGVTLCYVFLDETHPRERVDNDKKHFSVTNSRLRADAPSHIARDKSMHLRQLLSVPVIWALAMSGFSLTFLSTAFDVVFVLFCYSPVHSGGLAFSAAQIGYALAGSGVISAMFQVFIMSYLLRTFDSAKMYNFCMAMWPWSYIALPLLNLIARSGIDEETGRLGAHTTAILWIAIAIVLGLSRVASLPLALSMILIKANAPSPALLGQSNGIVQFAMCSARSFAPFLVSSLFAWSISSKFHHLWVIIMASFAFFAMFISRKISLLSKRTIP